MKRKQKQIVKVLKTARQRIKEHWTQGEYEEIVTPRGEKAYIQVCAVGGINSAVRGSVKGENWLENRVIHEPVVVSKNPMIREKLRNDAIEVVAEAILRTPRGKSLAQAIYDDEEDRDFEELVIAYNDSEKTQKKDVLRIFDSAIKQAEKELVS